MNLEADVSTPANVIFGCSGLELTHNEKALFSDVCPWGLILFARNLQSPEQTRSLIQAFADCVGRDNAIVLIDQEGGRVSRLPSEHWRVPPSPTEFQRLFSVSPFAAKRAIFLNYLLIAIDLKALGVNVNCAPMLDVASKDAAPVVTDRALGSTPAQVAELGMSIAAGLRSGGVAPVVKHAPGHGRAIVDSHVSLPRLDTTIEDLRRQDLIPFKKLNKEPMMMTAHVVYEAFDSRFPATVSRTVINDVLRDEIGFEGLIMTDDLNMQALGGPVEDKFSRAIEAGCDIGLHCSGDYAEMKAMVPRLSMLTGPGLERAKKAEQVAFSEPRFCDEAAVLEELEALMPSRER